MHAGGVLIASGKITDFCPVYCTDSGESVISQLDKDDVEKIGLVKFDFLGLRTLTILDWTVRYIRQRESKLRTESAEMQNRGTLRHPESFSLENLPWMTPPPMRCCGRAMPWECSSSNRAA